MDRPRTAEGALVFETAIALGGQLRFVSGMGGGGATGVDFAAATAFGEAKGCDRHLLADLLPIVETALLKRGRDEEGEDGDEA
ncbi:hypothetical protein AAG607_12070 [Citromicrobium bathyomarinum]|uniref:DUF7697 family protein n=1 Tax=Citromicrobium bathyomarinum TaxID=72174 RepID=UPI00315A3665